MTRRSLCGTAGKHVYCAFFNRNSVLYTVGLKIKSARRSTRYANETWDFLGVAWRRRAAESSKGRERRRKAIAAIFRLPSRPVFPLLRRRIIDWLVQRYPFRSAYTNRYGTGTFLRDEYRRDRRDRTGLVCVSRVKNVTAKRAGDVSAAAAVAVRARRATKKKNTAFSSDAIRFNSFLHGRKRARRSGGERTRDDIAQNRTGTVGVRSWRSHAYYVSCWRIAYEPRAMRSTRTAYGFRLKSGVLLFDFSERRRLSLCVGCGGAINDQYILKVAPDLEWHAACLKCAECHQFLDEHCTCFVRDGKTYCKLDYVR